MAQFDPVALGRRLKRALDDRGWDVKRLQREVRQKIGNARGTSYGSVWSYVNGKAPAEPRREVVEAFEDLLGLRRGHLMHGGPPTEEHALVSEAADGLWSRLDEVRRQRMVAVVRAVKQELSYPEESRPSVHGLRPEEQTLPIWAPLTIEAWRRRRRLEDARAIAFEGDPPDDEAVAREIGRALAAPLRILAGGPENFTSRGLDDYMTLMLPVLLNVGKLEHRELPSESDEESPTPTED